MSTALQPLSQAYRDQNLDVLRGFALTGVLFVFCAGDIGISNNYTNSTADEAVKWFKWVMVEERMYGMLILVFGLGFGVQVRKAMQKNESIVPVFLRRLSGLLIIGFVHAVLISNRDILMFYALAGFALLPARNFSNRALLIYLLIVLLAWIEIFWILGALGIKPVPITSWVPPNDFRSYWAFNWQFFKEYHQMYVIYPHMLFAFLLGFYFERTGVLKRIVADNKLRKKLLLWSLVITVFLASLFYGWIWTDAGSKTLDGLVQSSWLKFIFGAFMRLVVMLKQLIHVAFYALLLVTINSSTRGKMILQPLARFGQMALSNYLIQSLILVPYALLFNKFNNMPPMQGTLLFLIMLTFQLYFSTAWLKRFRFGPFEWLLRSFTYWKWQPIKKPMPGTEVQPAKPELTV
jgi:uncharacterized protein